MSTETDDWNYLLIFEDEGKEFIETFYTQQEMDSFIEEHKVNPLWCYKECE